MSRFKVLILLLLTLIRIVSGYQYVLIPRDENYDRCRNNTCEDGELHSICLKEERPSVNCSDFKWLYMTPRRKAILINGHNGIRNKLAKEWGISNMLILHWDNDLAMMARGFLTRCMIAKDSCDYIYNDTFNIGQTYYYNPKLALNRFVITIMRFWFLELNDVREFHQFIKTKPPNITVITYPPTEFFGCAAAEMFGGHMMRCYYSPGPDDDPKAYLMGKPCKNCPEERSSCSRLFRGLCGLDLPLPSTATQLAINNYKFAVIMNFILFSKST